MNDMIGNPIWNGDTVAYTRKTSKLMLGKVRVLNDKRWGHLYVRITDIHDESQCLRVGKDIVVCREPPHHVKAPWPGAELP